MSASCPSVHLHPTAVGVRCPPNRGKPNPREDEDGDEYEYEDEDGFLRCG